MRTAEWISVAFYVALAVGAGIATLPPGRRARILVGGGAGILAAWSLRFLDTLHGGLLMRDLAPALLLLIGYWLSGQFFRGANPGVQATFRSIEQRWFPWVQGAISSQPRRWLSAYFEASYVWCYALIPAGVLVLHATGHVGTVDRFWTVLLTSTFACHGCTVLLPSLPPWLADANAEATAETSAIRSLNKWLLTHSSITVNTFPSGHVASSFGATLVVVTVAPMAGLAFLWMAASIGVATTVLRYHYTLDGILGAALALLVFGLF